MEPLIVRRLGPGQPGPWAVDHAWTLLREVPAAVTCWPQDGVRGRLDEWLASPHYVLAGAFVSSKSRGEDLAGVLLFRYNPDEDKPAHWSCPGGTMNPRLPESIQMVAFLSIVLWWARVVRIYAGVTTCTQMMGHEQAAMLKALEMVSANRMEVMGRDPVTNAPGEYLVTSDNTDGAVEDSIREAIAGIEA